MKVLSTMTFNYPNSVLELYTYYHNKLFVKGVDNSSVPMLMAQEREMIDHYWSSTDKIPNKRWYYIIPSKKYKQYFLKHLIKISRKIAEFRGNAGSFHDVIRAPSLFKGIYTFKMYNRIFLTGEESPFSEFKFIPRVRVSMKFLDESIIHKYKKVILSYLYLYLRDYLDIYNIDIQGDILSFDLYFVTIGLKEVVKVIFKELNTLIYLFEPDANHNKGGEVTLKAYIDSVTYEDGLGIKGVKHSIDTYNKDPYEWSVNKVNRSGNVVDKWWGTTVQDECMADYNKFFTEFNRYVEDYTGYSSGAIKNDPYYNAMKGSEEKYESIFDRVTKIKEYYFISKDKLTTDGITTAINLSTLYKKECKEMADITAAINGKDKLYIALEVKEHSVMVSQSSIVDCVSDYINCHLKQILEDIKIDESAVRLKSLSMKQRYKAYKLGEFKTYIGNTPRFSYEEKLLESNKNELLNNIVDLVHNSEKFDENMRHSIIELKNNYQKISKIENIRLKSGLDDIILPEIFKNLNSMLELTGTDSFNELNESMLKLLTDINEKMNKEYLTSVENNSNNINNSISAIGDIFDNMIYKEGDSENA